VILFVLSLEQSELSWPPVSTGGFLFDLTLKINRVLKSETSKRPQLHFWPARF